MADFHEDKYSLQWDNTDVLGGEEVTMNSADIQNRIEDLAKEKGMTMYELSKVSGVSLSGIYNMFKRNSLPKLETLLKICKGLDTSLSDFFVFLSEPKEGGKITKRDEAILEVSRSLNERNMERLVVYATGLRDSQDNK